MPAHFCPCPFIQVVESNHRILLLPPWLILMRFSTVDSAGPEPRGSTPLSPAQPQLTKTPSSQSTGRPGLNWDRMCVSVWGGGEAVCRWSFTRNESESKPQWEGPQSCRIFLNEITPRAPPPSTLRASSMPVAHWSTAPVDDVRQALLWMSPRAGAPILPPMSASEGLKKRRCKRRQVRIWGYFDEDRSACRTKGLSS